MRPTRTVIQMSAAVLAAILLAACDPAYPLFFRNGLTTPVLVRVTYANSTSTESILKPRERLTFLHTNDRDIERIALWSGERKLHELDKRALIGIRNSVPDARDVTWNIQFDAIMPLSKSQLQLLQ
jgi:hypothetical protein